MVIHSNFKVTGRFPEHDIAAIKPKIKFGHILGRMQPIPLPPPKISNTGVDGTIFGWGALKEFEYPSPTNSYLHKASIPILRWRDCNKLLPRPKNVLCAGYFQGGVDPCHGDCDTSPLFVRTRE